MTYRYERVASEPDYAGQGSKRLRAEIEKVIKGTGGKIVEAEMYEPAKGGGWGVVLDSEYAALKVYYKYRKDNVNLDKTPKGWAVTLRK